MQVRVVALGSAADLFKSPDAQNYLSAHPDFLQVLVQCMQVLPVPFLYTILPHITHDADNDV